MIPALQTLIGLWMLGIVGFYVACLYRSARARP